MNAASWKTGLLLATLIPVVLGLQTAALWITGNLPQRQPPPLPVERTTAGRPAVPPVAAEPPFPAMVSRPAPAGEIPPPRPDNPQVALPAAPTPAIAVPPPPATPAVAPPSPVMPEPVPPPASAAAGGTIASSAPVAGENTKPPAGTALKPPKAIQPAGDQPPAAAAPPAALQEPAWLQTRDPTRFTIQLQSGDSLDKLKVVASSHQLPEPLAYYRVFRNGKPWYTLIAGDYPERQAAYAAAAKLTAFKPWIRGFGEIQEQSR